uniref:Uncharacterized protein n=1 Tax=Lactuca sativa TaxID=4236 RepID=A0A9R1VIH8_LACSA|nr:hypothetical protein LSAT_V11C500283980 [Lactuca sativa]
MGSGHSMSNGAMNPKVPKEFFLVHKESKRNTLAPDHESNPWAFYSISPEQAKRFTKIREREGLIENDVLISQLLQTKRLLLFLLDSDIIQKGKKGYWVIMPSCYEIMNLLYQIATDYNLTKHGNNMN